MQGPSRVSDYGGCGENGLAGHPQGRILNRRNGNPGQRTITFERRSRGASWKRKTLEPKNESKGRITILPGVTPTSGLSSYDATYKHWKSSSSTCHRNETVLLQAN